MREPNVAMTDDTIRRKFKSLEDIVASLTRSVSHGTATIEALTKRVEELEAKLAPGEQFHSTGEYTKPPPLEPDKVTVFAVVSERKCSGCGRAGELDGLMRLTMPPKYYCTRAECIAERGFR